MTNNFSDFKLIVLADIHGRVQLSQELLNAAEIAQAFVVCGDITNFGGRDAAWAVVHERQKLKIPGFYVTGNCDTTAVGAYLEEEGMLLGSHPRTIAGYNLFGVSGSTRCPGRTPGELSEDQFRAEFLQIACHPTFDSNSSIIVAHQPPYGCKTDQIGTNNHAGSKAVRQFIESASPLLYLSGHIHEAQGTDWLGNTLLINPGPYRNNCFALVSFPDLEVRFFR